MKPVKDILIPKNYDEELPALKKQCFSWKMHFSSKTDLNAIGQITYYSINDDSSSGNLVLVPGLASNTEIEPLMRTVMYWSLKHKYNVYAIDTPLGDFKPVESAELAAQNTVPAFIDLMDTGLEIVSEMASDKWACVVGHSLGGAGTLEIFNRRILAGQPVGFSGAIMFAPYLVKDWLSYLKQFFHTYEHPGMSDEEYEKATIRMGSPHDVNSDGQYRFISLYPKVFDDMSAFVPRPDLMAKYDIPVTLVAGGLDRKSPAEYIRDIYDRVRACPNGKKVKFVEFPTARHSFIDQYSDNGAILRLIKTQLVRTARNKTK